MARDRLDRRLHRPLVGLTVLAGTAFRAARVARNKSPWAQSPSALPTRTLDVHAIKLG